MLQLHNIIVEGRVGEANHRRRECMGEMTVG
jgi:hypothetical protein